MRGLLLLRRPVCLTGCGLTIQPLLRRHHSSLVRGGAKKAPRPSFDVPSTPCRTRFAPSPTGYLHLGSIRTALYNYLLAKSTNGQFILRLEDTDQSRLVSDAEQRLYEDLRWAGLTWDEGPDVGGPYGPYRQSERLHIYDEHVNQLLQKGKAYRCFCSHEELREYNRSVNGGYAERGSNPCIHISAEESEERASKGEQHAVVFKSSAAPVPFDDIVYNRFRSAKPEIEFIVRKRDGFPTYHLANVVDDHIMKITHVIRGAEWLISTPKHIDLYNAFGWEPPKFAHVGLLIDQARQKLSKRHEGVTMDWYKDRKIQPAALLNFAALLGWAPKSHTEGDFMTLEDMVRKFHLKFTKGDIMVNMPKLEFFQEQHGIHQIEQLLQEEPRDMAKIQERIMKPLASAINAFTPHEGSTTAAKFGMAESEPSPPMAQRAAAAYDSQTATVTDPEYFLETVRFTKLMVWKPTKFVSDYKWLLWEVPESVLVDVMKKDAETRRDFTIDGTVYSPVEVMELIQGKLASLGADAWTLHDLTSVIKEMDKGVKRTTDGDKKGPKQNIYGPIRWAVTAGENGPPVWEQMMFLGRDETLRRFKLAAEVARRMA